MADYTYAPPNSTGAPKQNTQGNNPKPRIYNVFPATIVLDEMSLTFELGDRKTEDQVSSLFPLIKINDYYFTESEINRVTIESNDGIPKITASFSLVQETFLTKNMPKDGDVLSIMIKSKSEVLKPIRNDYLITGVLSNNRHTEKREKIEITIYGHLFIPGIKNYLNGFYKKGTSMEALKGVAKVLGLGFNTNEDNTDDSQLWIMKDNYQQFIDDTVERAWKDDNSFWDWWIDVYYNLNFVNVQKQLLASEDEIDMASAVNSANTEYIWGSNEKENAILPKIFSNMVEIRNTSSYIKRWGPTNNSSGITNDYGLTLYCDMFEHNDTLYKNPDSQQYWSIQNDPVYDKEKINSFILLRGRTYLDPCINTGSMRANIDYNELYKKHSWAGIQYTVSNPNEDVLKWNGNHHKNYNRAKTHNIINLVELSKLLVEIEVRGVNLNVIRGDKIPVVIVKRDLFDRMANNNDGSDFSMDRFYSGWYYVKGFNLYWSKKIEGEILSNFSQSFVLTRREWPPPVPVMKVK